MGKARWLCTLPCLVYNERRATGPPVLLIYGEHEAGEGHAWEQYQAAGEPKALWIVPGCGHGGYPQVAPEEWEQRVVAFFNGALLPRE